MKRPTVFGLREYGAMLLALDRLAELPPPPLRWTAREPTRYLLREVSR